MAHARIIDTFVAKELKVPRTVAITESDAANKVNCKVLRCFGPRYLVAFADGAVYKVFDKDHKQIEAPKVERRVGEIFNGAALPSEPMILEIFPGASRILAADLLMLDGKPMHLQAYRLRLEHLAAVVKSSNGVVCATPYSDPTHFVNAPSACSRQTVILRSLDEFANYMVNHVVTKASVTRRYVCVGETTFIREKQVVLKREPFVHHMQTPLGLQRLLLSSIASNLEHPIDVDVTKFENDKKYQLEVLNQIKDRYLEQSTGSERVVVKYPVEDKGFLIAYHNPNRARASPFHIFAIVKKLSCEVDKSAVAADTSLAEVLDWDNQAFKAKCKDLIIFAKSLLVDIDEKSKVARENIINTTAMVVAQYSLSVLKDLPDPLSLISTRPLAAAVHCTDSKLMRALRAVNEFVTSASVGLNDADLAASGFRSLRVLDEIVNAALTAKLLAPGARRQQGDEDRGVSRKRQKFSE